MSKSYSKSILLFCIFLSFNISAQERQEITRAHKMYNRIQMALMKKDFEAVEIRLDSMMQMAIEDSDSLQIGYAYQTQASMASAKGDYEKYTIANNKSLDIFTALKKHDLVCMSYSHMAGSERQKGNLDKAFEYAFVARDLLPKTTQNQASVFNSNILSLIFKSAGKLDSAIYYELDVIKRLPPTDSVGMSKAYTNLASSFKNIGNYKKQKEYLDIAHDYAMKKGLMSTTGKVYYDLSQYEITHGNVDKALELAEKSIEYYRGSKWGRSMIFGYVAIASAYNAKGNYKKAKIYIDSIENPQNEKNLEVKANYYLTKLNIEVEEGTENTDSLLIETEKIVTDLNQLQSQSRFYTLGIKHYRSIRDYKMADLFAQNLENVNSKLSNWENRQIVNNLEIEYESEKKELAISNLELINSKQNQKLIGGGIALTLISLLSFFLFRLYKKVKGQKKVISKALSEKDILLREIHHRVKNNLQLVSSLLTLQGQSIDDKTVQQAINEGKSRVRSMALIHQDLYNKENLTDISVKDYLEKLTNELFHTYKIDSNKVQLHLDIQDIDLDVDTLVPLGLIINELITNCLKYAFPKNQSGNLNVKLAIHDKNLILNVVDDGIGYVPNDRKDTSFGSTLISALTEQLEGQIEIQSKNGTSVKIIFPHT